MKENTRPVYRNIGIGICNTLTEHNSIAYRLAEEELKNWRNRIYLYEYRDSSKLLQDKDKLDILMVEENGGHEECRKFIQILCEINRDIKLIYLTPQDGEDAIREKLESSLYDVMNREGVFVSGKEVVRVSHSYLVKSRVIKYICYREICNIECLGDEIVFYLQDGEAVLVREKLYRCRDKMGRRFVQTHKSHCVNMDYIKNIKDRSVMLQNGMEVPVSVRKEKEIKKLFGEYTILYKT